MLPHKMDAMAGGVWLHVGTTASKNKPVVNKGSAAVHNVRYFALYDVGFKVDSLFHPESSDFVATRPWMAGQSSQLCLVTNQISTAIIDRCYFTYVLVCIIQVSYVGIYIPVQQ